MSDDATSPSAAAPKPDRTLRAILIAVAAIVVIAVVVVAVRSMGTPTLDPATPEGVVQAYSRAVLAGDDAAAAQYLAGSPEDCGNYDGEEGNLRLTLRSTAVSGDVATVKVTVTTSYGYGGGPFSNSEYSYDDAFRLVRSDGSWLVDETPYEFISCGVTAVD